MSALSGLIIKGLRAAGMPLFFSTLNLPLGRLSLGRAIVPLYNLISIL